MDLPRLPLEHYFRILIGEDPVFLPRMPWEFYFMILVGEMPPDDVGDLPRRSLGYYLSILAFGDESGEGYPDEVLWMTLAQEAVPDNWDDLPRRELEYYLMLISVQGLTPFYRFYINNQTGQLIQTFSVDAIEGVSPWPPAMLVDQDTGMLEDVTDVSGLGTTSINGLGQFVDSL